MLNDMSMISSQIRQISKWGVKRFIIITNPEFDNLIKEDIDKNHPEKNISFTIQEEPLGIAHALLQVENLIEVDENTDIIKKGDIVNFIPFKEALI